MAGGENQSAQTRGGRMKFWSLGLVALVLGLAFFGDRGVLHFIKLSNQKAMIAAELEQVEKQNSGLRQEIAMLRGDRHYIERLARTELGMVRDDELVFQFAEKPR